MKRLLIAVIGLTLLFGMAQCKKNNDHQEGEAITRTIHLKVSDDGSKLAVNPNLGTVGFTNGDTIYVAYNGVFAGTLTHNGTDFTGDITTSAADGAKLTFYFMGNKTPTETLNTETTTLTVSIFDQTDNYPVISCGLSYEDYTADNDTYTAFLYNKCALVKFDVTSESLSPTIITGVNDRVQVTFAAGAQGGFDYSSDKGRVKVPGGSGERWAILLPQAAVDGQGLAYSVDGKCTGSRASIPVIAENGYVSNGISVNVTTYSGVDLGLPSGLLWAKCNVGADTPEGYGDYFAWGETTPKDTYNWSTYQYSNGSDNTLTKYFADDLTTLLPEDDAATANLGDNWRMPTKEEWQELYNNTDVTWTTQNGVNGCLFTASNDNSLFLPAAGYHNYSSLNVAGIYGLYWSSSLYTDDPHDAWYFVSTSGNYFMSDFYRYGGLSVRAVRSASQN